MLPLIGATAEQLAHMVIYLICQNKRLGANVSEAAKQTPEVLLFVPGKVIVFCIRAMASAYEKRRSESSPGPYGGLLRKKTLAVYEIQRGVYPLEHPTLF